MPNELILSTYHPEYNPYPEIINFSEKNPVVRSPYAPVDLYFYATRDTLNNPEDFRNFIKAAESSFRSCREYKAYKSYLIELGINRCQYFGNITTEDADIELHHEVLSLFDICVLITMHVINTVGKITTFDLVQILIQEHWKNHVGVVFLSETVHQLITADPDHFIPNVFGAWWELLSDYRFGITYDLAYKIIKYIKKNQDQLPISISAEQQEQILNFAWLSEYGVPAGEAGEIPYIEESNTKDEVEIYEF